MSKCRKIRQFYLVFSIRDAVRSESNRTQYRLFPNFDQFVTQCVANLNWTRTRHIMRVENEKTLMNEGDNPPIGTILCVDKSDTIVKYTLPENNKQIFASKYQLYLPSEEELRREVTAERRRIEGTK